jgi:hypothetical protein
MRDLIEDPERELTLPERSGVVDAAETRVGTVVAPTGSARETVTPLEMAFEVVALAP